MKIQKSILPLFSLILFTISYSATLSSQSVSENFGGMKTNFIMKSDTLHLDVTDQLLVKRGIYKTYINSTLDAGHAAGYSELFFEFITKKKLNFSRIYWKHKAATFIGLKFKSKDGNQLYRTEISYKKVKPNINTKKEGTIYSINMETVPMLVLDKTHEIDISIITRSRDFLDKKNN